MRVLILGGTRFIGPPVVRRLVDLDHEVTVFHRGQSEADLPAGVRHLHGDRRAAGWTAPLAALAPEVVLDMAPLVEADARAVVDVFRGVARRLVALSSADVYRAYGKLLGREAGPPEPVPMPETAPLREHLYPYRGDQDRVVADSERWREDYDKIPVERMVMGEATLPGTVLRLPMVHGPGDYQHRLWPYLKRMDDGRPAILLDETGARWQTARGYVENVAAAIALAVTDERAAGRIFNVADAEITTEAEWVAQIARAAGWHGQIRVLPAGQLPTALDARHHLATDSDRIRRELGYTEPVSRQAGLRAAVAWERANPPPEWTGKGRVR